VWKVRPRHWAEGIPEGICHFSRHYWSNFYCAVFHINIAKFLTITLFTGINSTSRKNGLRHSQLCFTLTNIVSRNYFAHWQIIWFNTFTALFQTNRSMVHKITASLHGASITYRKITHSQPCFKQPWSFSYEDSRTKNIPNIFHTIQIMRIFIFNISTYHFSSPDICSHQSIVHQLLWLVSFQSPWSPSAPVTLDYLSYAPS